MTKEESTDFSSGTAQALRRAGQVMRQTERGDVHGLYDACRAALTHVSDIDACYIGHFRETNRLVIPYLYNCGQAGSPDVTSFGDFGLSHWMRSWRKTYTYAQDQGRLIHAGRAFADTPVRDAVVAPLFDHDGSVGGMLAALSYSPGHFTAEQVHAVEWLARQLRRAISRDTEDLSDLNLVATGSEAVLDRSADLVHAISDRLLRLRQRVDQAVHDLDTGAVSDATERLREVSALCERFDTELALLATEPGAVPMPPAALTVRETDVTRLIVQEGLSNAEIGERLVISEKTVKAHLSHVFQKVGITQRSELRYIAASLGLGPPATPK